ncbi:MAG: hypothetical protein IKB28_03005 [Clostridia bacterium]|nr:hypothetical protein [Clostridia bacterium]
MRKNHGNHADGYIKNQNMHLKELRLIIWTKVLLFIIPTLGLAAIMWSILAINPPPDKWVQKQITYAGITEETNILRKSHHTIYVLHTAEGEGYILSVGTDEMRALSQELQPNRQYTLTYCENFATRIILSLSYEDQDYISMDESLAAWKRDQRIGYIFTAIMLGVATVGSTMSYLFWCKKERQQLQTIRNKIQIRRNKKQKINSQIQ